MRNINRSELEDILLEHRYSSADDVVSEECSCGQWPKWKPNGEPTVGWEAVEASALRPAAGRLAATAWYWIEHVLSSADVAYPDSDMTA